MTLWRAGRQALIGAALACLLAAGPALPQADAPPYEPQLERLAEILGALHYLRPLCASGEGQRWRNEMDGLLAAENPEEPRRARLIDRFNLGYSGFASVYRICTPGALLAAEQYQGEGAALAADLANRYGR